MKRKHMRKYLRQAEDKLEETGRKMRHIEDAMFFIILGMEAFHQNENSCEVSTVHTIRDYIKTVRTKELMELGELLSHLKEL